MPARTAVATSTLPSHEPVAEERSPTFRQGDRCVVVGGKVRSSPLACERRV